MYDLFGKYCYIDTPWIAGEKTRYRIIGNGVRSNSWCEVPVTGRTELIHHDYMEEVVFVVLDTLVSDDSIIRRFALKDVDVMPADVRPVRRGRWELDSDNIPCCTECGCVAPQRLFLQVKSLACTTQFILSDYCPDCGSYNGTDMTGGDAE